MKKSRFSEEQIIRILKEQKAGSPVADTMLDNAMLKDINSKNGVA